jgi:hypothetical protein
MGRDPFHRTSLLIPNRPFAIEGLSQGIDYSPDKPVPHWNLNDTPGATHLVALFYLGVVAEDDSADAILFQIKGQPHSATAEFEKLVVFGSGQPVDAGNAIAKLNHSTDIHRGYRGSKLLDLLPDYGSDVLSSNHFLTPPTS